MVNQAVAHLDIRCPMWNGGKRIFGFAEYRMTAPVLEVSCTATNKDGQRIYPHHYQISREKAMTYPVKVLQGSGVVLRLIPVDEFTVVPAGK